MQWGCGSISCIWWEWSQKIKWSSGVLMAGWYLPRLISYENMIMTTIKIDPMYLKKIELNRHPTIAKPCWRHRPGIPVDLSALEPLNLFFPQRFLFVLVDFTPRLLIFARIVLFIFPLLRHAMVRLLDHPTCGFSVPDPYIPAYQVPSNTFRGSILFCHHLITHRHASTNSELSVRPMPWSPWKNTFLRLCWSQVSKRWIRPI